MVKSLRYWEGRETTLQIGDEIYTGKVMSYDAHPRNAGRNAYYFQASDGKRIEISGRTLRCVDGHLVKKLNASNDIH